MARILDDGLWKREEEQVTESSEACVFLWDTETTGVDRHARVIEIAVREYRPPHRSIDHLVNPLKSIRNAEVHGITDEAVVTEQTFDLVWDKVSETRKGGWRRGFFRLGM